MKTLTLLFFLASITPDQFQDVALKWIASLVAIFMGFSGALILILPKLKELRDRLAELMARQDRQGVKINQVQGQVFQVAKDQMPVGNAEKRKAEIGNAEE